MHSGYTELLSATIHHLEGLKSKGASRVRLSKDQLDPLFSGRRSAKPAASHGPAPSAPKSSSMRTPNMASGSAPAASQASTPSEPRPVAAAIHSGQALNPSEKDAAIRNLRERASACVKCPNLVRSRKNVVFGVGDIHAPLMFVGEAPGADEDVQGEPFVGKAGQLLTKIIQTMGFSRDQVYIANVLKCRPDMPEQSSGNRKPTVDEMRTCLPYLTSQIEIIRPQVIVALGGTAMEGLFAKPCFITRTRGAFLEWRGVTVMPTYHPSYLLRNQSLKTKREVWEDMLQVMEKLNLPISEKHRGYFLT